MSKAPFCHTVKYIAEAKCTSGEKFHPQMGHKHSSHRKRVEAANEQEQVVEAVNFATGRLERGDVCFKTLSHNDFIGTIIQSGA